MKQLVIDRLEGKYAICTDKDQKFFAIELPELPAGAKAGSVLTITDEGELRLDEEGAKPGQRARAEAAKNGKGERTMGSCNSFCAVSKTWITPSCSARWGKFTS